MPLSPLTFLKRAAGVYSDRLSIIHRSVRFTWSQTYERCCRLASALNSLNIAKNDVVSLFLLYYWKFMMRRRFDFFASRLLRVS